MTFQVKNHAYTKALRKSDSKRRERSRTDKGETSCHYVRWTSCSRKSIHHGGRKSIQRGGRWKSIQRGGNWKSIQCGGCWKSIQHGGNWQSIQRGGNWKSIQRGCIKSLQRGGQISVLAKKLKKITKQISVSSTKRLVILNLL